MNTVLIIGSGISALYCAINLAKEGARAVMVSPQPSERAQSVMAAGGINAALDLSCDSPALHAQDTMHGGRNIANSAAVEGLCQNAPDIIKTLSEYGVVFSRESSGSLSLRAFGGQSQKRTVYAGASTGKQIVSALVREARKYESCKSIVRRTGEHFLAALIQDGVVYGALVYNALTKEVNTLFADALVLATGGQNLLFGKTTGSALCDGSAAAKVFLQGAKLKNLEFIQYHPTTIETPRKRMLISEAARGEGGRLFYTEGGKRRYFLEERYGEGGNLMPRDVVSKAVYDAPSQVYLDVSFLDKKIILSRLYEVYSLCKRYINLDITKDVIPIYPSVHFFMGGIAVDLNHETNIHRLYAIGECACAYHGANRLGGNSLLAALYGASVCAKSVLKLAAVKAAPDFTHFAASEREKILRAQCAKSKFPTVYIMEELSRIMNQDLGITRSADKLSHGIRELDFYADALSSLKFDGTLSPYQSYALPSLVLLAKATLLCALNRTESRGAHIRDDFPTSDAAFEASSVISYNGGSMDIRFEKEV